MLVHDAQFAGFHGLVRRDNPRFTAHVRVAPDFDPWATRSARATSPAAPGVAIQHIIRRQDHPSSRSDPDAPPHLVLKGMITRTGGAPLPRGDWTANLVALATQLVEGGLDSLATWDGDFILGAYFPATDQFALYRSLTCSKSVYYRIEVETFAFSTNPLDLLPVEREVIDTVDVGLLPALVTGGRYAPTRSCYRDLLRLPTGHLLTVADGQLATRRIADFAPVNLGRISLDEAADAARGELLASASRAIAPGQKVGVFVSGGIDSAVTAYVAQAAGADVTALHFSAKGYGPADEHGFAAAVCRHLHLPQVNIEVVPFIKAGGKYVDTAQRFPLAYAAPYFQWYAAAAEQAGDRGLQTVTTGALGDQIFGGMNTPDVRSLFARMGPRTAWTYAKEFLGTYIPLDRVLKASTTRPDQRFARLTDSLEASNADQFLTPWAHEAALNQGRYRYVSNRIDTVAEGIANNTTSTLNTEFDSAHELAALLPRGIQFTRLLADRDLINFGLGLPPGYRWFPAGGQFYQKPVLRLAFVDLLPAEVVSRNFRTYLQGVDEEYCRNNRRFLIDLLGEESRLAQLGVIEPRGIRKVLTNQADFPEASTDLVAAAMVELWLRSLEPRREAIHAADPAEGVRPFRRRSG